MAHSARGRLSEAIDLFGNDGTLVVFHDPDDPCGTTAEGADLAPLKRVEPVHPELSEKVAKVNARSRGELL
ncbi:hypothetical protein [Streptomyces sp. NPDC002547]